MIISCRCLKDLDACFSLYGEEFNLFLEQYKEQNSVTKFNEMKQNLNTLLEKVGLKFSDSIEILNEDRWEQVSLFV